MAEQWRQTHRRCPLPGEASVSIDATKVTLKVLILADGRAYEEEVSDMDVQGSLSCTHLVLQGRRRSNASPYQFKFCDARM